MAADQTFGFGFRIWARNETGRPAEAAAQNMRKVGRAANRAGDEAQRSGRKFRKMGREGMAPAAKATSNLTRNFLLLAAAATAFFAIRGVKSFLSKMTDQANTTEQQILVLSSVLGSATKGVEAYEFAVRKAAETPFEIEDVVEGFTLLEAFNIDTMKHLDLAGNMAFAMGKTLDDSVQALTMGTMGMHRTLRQRFGVNTAEMQKGLKGLTAGTDEYKEAVLEFLHGIERFQGGMERAQGSLKVIFSNIGDFFTELKIAVVGKPGEGLFADHLKAFYNNMLTTFTKTKDKLIEIMHVVGQVLSSFVDMMGRAFDAAWGPVQRWIDGTGTALTNQKQVVLPFMIWLELAFLKVRDIMRAFGDGWRSGSAAMEKVSKAIGLVFGFTEKITDEKNAWEEFAFVLGTLAASVLLLKDAFKLLAIAAKPALLLAEGVGTLAEWAGIGTQVVRDDLSNRQSQVDALYPQSGGGSGGTTITSTVETVNIMTPNIESQEALTGVVDEVGQAIADAHNKNIILERARVGENR